MSMTEERKSVEEKHFAILTKESVKVIAEAAGYASISEDAAAILGEDVSYRLREMAQNCAQYMKHAKRRRLTTDDFNKTLKQSDIQPVFGYRAQDPLPFRQTSDGELHFPEELDANFSNIAFNSYVPKILGETTIKAHWLAVEGVQKQSSLSQANQGKITGKKEITEELQLYYDNITNAILGYDEKIMKIALTDLRTNPQIVPLLPFFVNFVSNGVKKVSHDLSQLTKLLHTVKALINNPNLYLEPHPYLTLLVKGVMYCVLEPLAASINPTNDHWVLRDYAARLLGQIVHCWSSPVNHLRYNTVKAMKEALYDHTKPFCSHYGAVMGLLTLGYQCVEEVLVPHMSSYWPHLSTVMEEIGNGSALVKSDAYKVYGAILLAVELLMRKKMKEFEEEQTKSEIEKISNVVTNDNIDSDSQDSEQMSPPSLLSSKKPIDQFYSEMYEYFGDSLVTRLPEVTVKYPLFKHVKKEETVSLADPETASKSGEELLEEFMEQVRKQQEIDRIRAEEERIEREKMEIEEKARREREEIERLEREKIERQIREEEERQLQKQREEELEMKRWQRMQIEEEEEEEEYIHSEPSEGEGVDVENDNDVDISDKSEEKSDEEEETDTSSMNLTVKSTVSDPSQGIKLTIRKLPKIKVKINPIEPPKEREAKESKHSKRRKQSQKSPKEFDAFEFVDTPDPVEYRPRTYIYSSEGEGSTDSTAHRRPLTLKLKVKEARESMSD